MSDLKHMQYCVKLGNVYMQNKLDEMTKNGYFENDNEKMNKTINFDSNGFSNYNNNNDFSNKSRKWNSY